MNTTPQNPQKKFYSDEFPQQKQQAPALQSKLDPKPDCGEESYVGSGKLTGRKALITGGDSGIGRAAAIAYAREGADVAINYLPVEQPDAEEVKELIEKEGRRAVLLPGDLRDEAVTRRMVDDAAREMGGLDILVLNAAMQQAVDGIEKMDMNQMRATFETNIISMFYTTQQALQYLPEGASIITTTSVEAYSPNPYLLDYASTKSAIEVFSKALAEQLAGKGIRVNSVAPGPIWTPLQVGGGQLPEKLPQFGQSTPLGRAGQPVELSDVYVFLASDAASYVTGQVYGVTGGKLTN